MAVVQNEVHKSVLLNEVIDAFASFKDREQLVYFDGTYGRGGHFQEIYNSYKLERAIITDQDQAAIAVAKVRWHEQIQAKQVSIFNENFYEFSQRQKDVNLYDMVLLDLGVSSPQLDQGERGFSFNKDGPLDMRMNLESDLTAAKIINEYEPEDLIHIFKEFGEVQNPARVVRAIVQDRQTKPFTSTLQLSGLIERVEGWKKKGFHPATQFFMALRLVVNRELEVINDVLPILISQMRDEGRIAVITFHSLEDRIVKTVFKESLDGFLVNKKVIVPSEEECKINPRARSAKLRIFQKGVAPEKPDKFALRRSLRQD